MLRAYGVLASILDVAVADRRIHSNPARGVKLPRKVSREHRYLTHEQVSELAIAAGEKGTLVLLLAYCGLRWGEAAGLRVKDVDLVRRRLLIAQNAVEVGERHPRRDAEDPQAPLGALPADPRADVRRGVRGQEARSTCSSSMSAARTCTARRPARAGSGGRPPRSGLEGLTPHDLRHTAASLAVQSGANVKAVQRMLGHSSAAMTLDVYADLFDDDLDLVANRLEEGLARTDVGKMWAERVSRPSLREKERPHQDFSAAAVWAPWGSNPRPAES